MRVDFMRALQWPFKEAGSWVKLVFLVLMQAVVIGIPFYLGFLVDAMKQVSEGDDDAMPNLQDFVGLLWRGVMMFFIVIIFGIIPVSMLVMSFGGALVGVLTSAATNSAVGAASGVGLGLVGLMATCAVMLVLWIFLPMAILRFAARESVGAAFDFGGVVSDMLKGPLDYVAILVAVPVLTKAGLLVLAFLPGIGWLLSVPFLTYMAIAHAHLMGQYYAVHLSDRKPAQPDSPGFTAG